VVRRGEGVKTQLVLTAADRLARNSLPSPARNGPARGYRARDLWLSAAADRVVFIDGGVVVDCSAQRTRLISPQSPAGGAVLRALDL
jgi:hypothetical protein